MGTSWTTMDAARIHVRVVDPSETDHPVWDEGGPGDTPSLVIRSADDDMSNDALQIAGTLDEHAAFAWRIMREVREARDRARQGAPLPPAVTFDPDAFRRWLAQPAFRGAPEGVTKGSECAIPDTFNNLHHNIADIVETVLIKLNEERDSNQHPWRTAPDVTGDVVIDTTSEDSCEDCGGVVSVTVDGHGDEIGIDLYVSRLPWSGLLAGRPLDNGVPQMPGVDAVILALANIAGAVNGKVDRWRKLSSPVKAREGMAATLSDDEIECALRTLAELHELGDNADLSERQSDVMGRVGGLWAAEMFGDEDEDEATSAGVLAWESAGTDEPGDQNATSAYTPEGCTWVWYSIGPDRYGWSIALIGCNEGQEVFHTVIGHADDEAGAKQFAQNYEKNINTPE